MEFYCFCRLVDLRLKKRDIILRADQAPLKNTPPVRIPTGSYHRTLYFLDGMSWLVVPALAIRKYSVNVQLNFFGWL
jgi:hypothetical protein